LFLFLPFSQFLFLSLQFVFLASTPVVWVSESSLKPIKLQFLLNCCNLDSCRSSSIRFSLLLLLKSVQNKPLIS
jgi:hypothetical protein